MGHRVKALLFVVAMIVAWAALTPAVVAQDTLDYFTYGTVNGTQLNTNIVYVKVDLEQAWDKIKTPGLDGQCVQEGKPNVRMSVLKNVLPEQNPQFCDMENLQWWRGADQSFKNDRFVMSGNFYKSVGDYNETCGLGLGVSLSNGTWISGESNDDRKVHETLTSTLLIFNQEGRDKFHKYAEIVASTYDFNTNRQYVQAAVSGYLFKNRGVFVAQPNAISPNGTKPRAAVGISQDGKTLIFLAINGGGENLGDDLKETGKFYKTLGDLGAYSALNLDGSGSAQLVLQKLDADNPLLATKPSDIRNKLNKVCSKKFFRPIPIVIGIE